MDLVEQLKQLDGLEERFGRFQPETVIKRVGEWEDEWNVSGPTFQTIPATEETTEEAGLRIGVDDLTDEQHRAFDRIMEWQKTSRTADDVLRLGGYAGTGKSTLLSLFARVSKGAAFCCFTAKATDVLRRKMRQLGMPPGFLENNVSTIHGLIYVPVEGKKGEVLGWVKKDIEQVRAKFDCIVVDEASMVNAKMLEDLHDFDLPILAVGDHGQLPPVVGEGALMIDPDVRLETIHRQAEGNPIIALAHEVRTTGRLPRRVDLPEDGPIRYIDLSDISGLLNELYDEYDPGDIALLTYTNKTRQQLNRLGRREWLRDRFEDDTVVPGEQVICLKNHKRTIFNGMRGTVHGPRLQNKYWYDGRVEFPDHALRMHGRMLAGQFGRTKTFADLVEVQQELKVGVSRWREVGMLFDYGYALTVHKSQGSGFRVVVLKYERPGPVGDDDFRRWLYTAVSRSIDRLYIAV